MAFVLSAVQDCPGQFLETGGGLACRCGLLLAIVTLAYVGYNLLIKVSGNHVPADATTNGVAAICLQTGALVTSAIFAATLAFQGGQTFRLTVPSYAWALAGGLCIGIAEIAYLTIFSRSDPLPASVVIPTVVTGTVVVTLIVSVFVFGGTPRNPAACRCRHDRGRHHLHVRWTGRDGLNGDPGT